MALTLLNKEPYGAIITSHISTFTNSSTKTQKDINTCKHKNELLTNQFTLWLNETKDIICQSINIKKKKIHFKQFHPKHPKQTTKEQSNTLYNNADIICPKVIRTIYKEDFNSFISELMKRKPKKKKSFSLDLQNNSFSYEPITKTKVIPIMNNNNNNNTYNDNNSNTCYRNNSNEDILICKNNTINIEPIVEQPSLENKNKSSLSFNQTQSVKDSINDNKSNSNSNNEHTLLNKLNLQQTPSFNFILKDTKCNKNDNNNIHTMSSSVSSNITAISSKSNVQKNINSKSPGFTFSKGNNKTIYNYNDIQYNEVSQFGLNDNTNNNNINNNKYTFQNACTPNTSVSNITPVDQQQQCSASSNVQNPFQINANANTNVTPLQIKSDISSGTNTLIHSIQALTFDNLNKNKYDDNNNNNYNSEYDSISEYSISEASESCDESDSQVNKKIPSWAKDTQYIKRRIQKQIVNNEHIQIFGKFKVEKLNLSMIFYGNQDEYTNRNSTADWKGDTSFVANSSNIFDNYDNNNNNNKLMVDKSAKRVLNFDNE